MRKVLTSFGFGPHAGYLNAVFPTFKRYADAHGYDLFVPGQDFFKNDIYPYDRVTTRPHSWWKLPLFSHLFDRCRYDLVLWLDADVCVSKFDQDIADEVPPSHAQGLVWHQVPDGLVPNCGVWVVQSGIQEYLDDMWNERSLVHNPWWEQSSNMRLMGVDPIGRPCPSPPQDNPLFQTTIQLDYKWNPHINDTRGVPADARFRHATMYPDRIGVLRKWVAEAMG